MFKLWAKIYQSGKLLKDMVVENDNFEINRTKKIFDAIDTICYEYDLGKPIWLESNISEFKKLGKTRFLKDNFVEEIDFDFLEIQVMEEDF